MSFNAQTTSLTVRGDWLLSLNFDLLCGLCRYSLASRFLKFFINCCSFLHVLKLAGEMLSISPGGKELNGRLIRKWLCVWEVSRCLEGRRRLWVDVDSKRLQLPPVLFKIISREKGFLSLEWSAALFSLSVSSALRHQQNWRHKAGWIFTSY